MRRCKSVAVPAMLIALAGTSFADFKYSETTKITGGSMMGAMKFVGAFSKQARQATAPQTHTVAVKGNKLRDEHSDGRIQIIDLDGRRFIEIDPKAKTYGVLTFDEMKANMQRKQAEMQAKMKEEQAKHPDKANANVKLTPKFESSETGQTRDILGVTAKEVKARMEMQMESDDPQTKGQQISTVMNLDQWIAPSVPGYDEIKQFYMKMAKELDWVPGQVSQGMANSGMQLNLAELRKNNMAHVQGMPLVQYTSMTLAGSGTPAADAQSQPQPQAQPAAQHQDNSIPTSTSDAVVKGLGGLFNKKKKQQQEQQPQQTETSTPAPASTPGALMEMQSEVTNYSNDALDGSMFEPPAGYTLTKQDPSATPGNSPQ